MSLLNTMNIEESDITYFLIEQVKTRPYLYDVSHTFYKNRQILESSWTSIRNEMEKFTGIKFTGILRILANNC